MQNRITTLRAGWYDLLSRHRWDHAVTLTTRYALGRRQFSEAIEQRYVRRLARTAQHRIAWFAVFEPTMAGQWHSHLLLGGTQGLPQRKIQRAWTDGFTSVDTLLDPCPAIRYAIKYIDRDPDSFALSRRWIPLTTDAFQTQRAA